MNVKFAPSKEFFLFRLQAIRCVRGCQGNKTWFFRSTRNLLIISIYEFRSGAKGSVLVNPKIKYYSEQQGRFKKEKNVELKRQIPKLRYIR